MNQDLQKASDLAVALLPSLFLDVEAWMSIGVFWSTQQVKQFAHTLECSIKLYKLIQLQILIKYKYKFHDFIYDLLETWINGDKCR